MKSKTDRILKIKPVPVPKEYDHPEPPHEVLMKHEFTLGIIAPKGAGKTTLIINLLYMYKGLFHDIFVFSPTVLSDEKWDWLKKQKHIIAENKPLKKWIKEEEKRRLGAFKDQIVQNPPANIDYDKNTNEMEEFDGTIPEDNFYHNYTEADLERILVQQKKIIDALKKHGKPKYLADRLLLIFDDLVGSTLFSMAQDNLFKGFNTRHRHYSSSVIMVSQGYKEIPRTIRTNWSALILFEIANDREVKVIYEENTMGIIEKEWMDMFRHATGPDYSFLYLNSKKPRRLRCMMNFDKYLFYEGETKPNAIVSIKPDEKK